MAMSMPMAMTMATAPLFAAIDMKMDEAMTKTIAMVKVKEMAIDMGIVTATAMSPSMATVTTMSMDTGMMVTS